uniref:Glycosyltransferase family 18 catalytic domain-containing protein n=1 Tax=Mycena chlorophos TaxID=658473 RepID=A0ABQ0LPC7_MYCCL|nr:predicted protein [Mycena chlorophos]
MFSLIHHRRLFVLAAVLLILGSIAHFGQPKTIWKHGSASNIDTFKPTWKHAALGAPNIDILKPTILTSKVQWAVDNRKAIFDLNRCLEIGNCAENQTKVVIIASPEFISYKQGGYIGGEVIWAASTLNALTNMGYTIAYAETHQAAVALHHILDPLVKMVVFNPEQAFTCFQTGTCVRSEGNPMGIPASRMFSFCFWSGGDGVSPLGPGWSLAPEPLSTAPFLGYSIEPQCSTRKYIPHTKRKRQAWLLGKYLHAFHPNKTAWPPEFYDAAAEELKMSFATAAVSERSGPFPKMSKTITNLVKPGETVLNQDEFYEQLSHSKVLVGLGDPIISPTPYDALCFGVPFINVIKLWDKTNPNDTTRWSTQHDGLRNLGPPFVYHVFAFDKRGFVDALRGALENPIDSYILPRMRMSAVEQRLGALLQHDWEKDARALLERRRRGEEKGPLFYVDP